MSTLANWSYVYDLTIWPVTVDEWGQQVYGTSYIVMGDWAAGGDVANDSNGTQFSPRSTYYFEAEDGSNLIPNIEDFILRGDHTAESSPPIEAERIRSIGGWGMKSFGDAELPDWRILT